MERPAVRIVESPFDRAADVRARSNRLHYWLERAGLMASFVAVNIFLHAQMPDDLAWWLRAVVTLCMGMIWGPVDEAIRIRYGRKRRDEEIEAEEEAKELAEVRAGRMHFAPIVR